MFEHTPTRRDVLHTTATLSVAAGTLPIAAAEESEGGEFVPGERIWSYSADGAVESGPTVVNKTVYFGCHDGTVYAIDAENGDREWVFETDDPPADQRYDHAGVWGEPKVIDGTVFIGALDNHLYALDADTGEEEWRFDTGKFVWGSPAVSNGTVYVPSRNHWVFAVDAESGEEQWRGNVEHPAGGGVSVVDGRVHVGSYGEVNLHTFDAESGELLWKKEMNAEQCAAPAVYDETVYTMFAGEPLYAFDAETGEEQWRFGEEIGFGINEVPTVWSGTVYLPNSSGLYAVDADTGELQWDFDGRFVKMSPTIADGVLFLGSHSETYLFAIDATTGEELWRSQVYANIHSNPTVVDGVAFFGSHDGYMHAVSVFS
ncbi:outer membrane protein assembly factor BamB family protein [Natrarchaeobius chitinivorans]|nr:PQQ-binding-like beta-propeller repeat protein [Natrarchaeobius chitinivorans]